MKFEYNGIKCDINNNLANSIIAYINAIFKYNQDLVIIFDGAEGAGKSTLMRQVGAFCAWYMQKTYNHKVPFDNNNILFDLENYLNHCVDNEKTKGIIHILDESRAIANRKRSTSSGNVDFTNYLSECRSAGHIHLIALPAFHDLDSYISTWRMSFLVNVRKYFKIVDEIDGVPIMDLVLGKYRVFLNDSTLKAMYYHKMRYIYPKKSKFTGSFSNESIIPESEYEDKKTTSRTERYKQQEESKNKKKGPTESELKILKGRLEHPQATRPELAKLLEMDKTTIYKYWPVDKK